MAPDVSTKGARPAIPSPDGGPDRKIFAVVKADGDGLAWLHAGRVLVGGHAAPLVTDPDLEHRRIDPTGVPQARVGDEVVIIGRQGAPRVSRVYLGAASPTIQS